MPELPDVTVYCEALEERIGGEVLERVRLSSPFLLRTAVPPIGDVEGRRVVDVRRLGKRIVIALEGELYLVLHLMIAGRLRWLDPGTKPPGRITLAIFEFSSGRLAFTEAGTKRRASLHLVRGADALAPFDMGGIDTQKVDRETFAQRLRSESHTLKRALTDPRLISGVGNAYSDEILHRARLSPLALTRKLSDAEMTRLHDATREVLAEWTERLRSERGGKFPEKVTAFRPQMAVHGRYREPCPACGEPVQRIAYAENECNYCARCQTGGRILADRSLSKLLHDSFPRSLDDN
ncbi:MAG TPA: DNA-formamidopyrimidine glycosylase family protein [Casimicrobiaceae bacterium]